MKKYYIESLGCPKNLVDSEVFSYLSEHAGYEPTDEPIEAELIIVNTCGFIIDAKEESVNTILELLDYKITGKCEILVATGCLVKRYLKDLKESLPEVDYFVNLKDFNAFARLLKVKPEIKRNLLTPPHFAYIRISDGCNNRCSYCAIPDIRGPLKSVPLEKLISEANFLAKQGVKELIITAQDTAQYGIDLYGEQKLPELLNKLHEIKGFKWIRILYLHPAHITTEIIDTIKDLPKINKYFDIPLQHINDSLLDKMNRKISKENTIKILDEIKTKIPEAVIRTTFILGFPGETEKRYTELKDFIIDQKFGRLGVFIYSQEDGTPAAKFKNNIKEEQNEAHNDEIMQIQQEISEKFLQKYVGQTLEVIIDSPGEDEGILWEGRTRFDSPEIDGIVYITEGKCKVGDIVKVEIVDSWEYDLIGIVK